MKEDNAIGIQYFSNLCNDRLLQDCEHELHSYGIQLLKRDLNGQIFHASPEFINLDAIAINYILMQNFLLSGSYDLLKHFLLKLWLSIRPIKIDSHPFTINISGIPTNNGPENICCKVSGMISDEQKNNIINNTFELAKDISDKNFTLLERSIYFDAFNAHIFNVDPQTLEINEIDIAKEIRKKVERKE